MFSLIITIVSIALVAALALATIYYGGQSYTQAGATAQAVKVSNQAQQLLAAAELFYAQNGRWSDDIPELVADGFLKTVPVAQLPVVSAALAAETPWAQPLAGQPVFLLEGLDVEACRSVNERAYGLRGVLSELRTGFIVQCIGTGADADTWIAVAARNAQHLSAVAAASTSITAEMLSSDPIPAGDNTAAWLVPPFGEVAQAVTPPVATTSAVMTLSQNELAFGAVATHTTSSLELTVTNLGTAALNFTAPATLSGESSYSILTNLCSEPVAPAGSCAITVSYAPTEVGASLPSALVLQTNAGDDVQVSLTATAFNPVSLGSATLPDARQGRVYTPFDFATLFNVSNEATPTLAEVTWSTTGALPAGMSFDPVTGRLAGTPTVSTAEAGVDFTVIATYKNNEGQQVYTLRVGEAIFDVVQLDVGHGHTCAITPAGGVKCWGFNESGQLGDGTNTNRTSPVDVAGLTSGVSAVSAGTHHSCAVTTSGSLKCWGYNYYGQLGDNSVTSRNSPVDVSGLSSGVSSISLGDVHTCAVTTSGGAKCWGYNTFGQLGDGTFVQRNVPVDVAEHTSGVSRVSSGSYHSCLMTLAGGAKCWGYGQFGQLGYGDSPNQASPVNVQGLTSDVSSISAGGFHTCAVTASGGAKCWGYNAAGGLGDASTTDRLLPRNVTGLTSGVSSISAGSTHTCAVTTAGGAKCWGYNEQGQVGDGSTTHRSTPVDVSGLPSGAQSISASNSFTCAVTSAGGAKCWGANVYGQFGNTTTSGSLVPVNAGL